MSHNEKRTAAWSNQSAEVRAFAQQQLNAWVQHGFIEVES